METDVRTLDGTLADYGVQHRCETLFAYFSIHKPFIIIIAVLENAKKNFAKQQNKFRTWALFALTANVNYPAVYWAAIANKTPV